MGIAYMLSRGQKREAQQAAQAAEEEAQQNAQPEERIEQAVQHYRLRHDPASKTFADELKKARQELCKTQDAVQEIMVMRQMDSPRQSYFLRRGAYG